MSVMRRILAPSFPRAVVRLARERWGLSVRVHDQVGIIDSVYRLGWCLGTNLFRPRRREAAACEMHDAIAKYLEEAA